jgi:hypothetical protein
MPRQFGRVDAEQSHTLAPTAQRIAIDDPASCDRLGGGAVLERQCSTECDGNSDDSDNRPHH